ncbi:uncharacterized protein VTP21DRAFT_9900 [Calcarisporiella thermophila]|uniref:uncharacterized protein n=1 Tax=Calcarisporiella thermophila TaxID=911321 RepID=UPI0037437674
MDTIGSEHTDTLTSLGTFIVYSLVVVFLVVFFLFYSSRLLAEALSRLIRAYTWRKYHVYIDIESIQFALLGGRILFKNVRYLSTNQSIYILKGHITFRYWLWNVRRETDWDDRPSATLAKMIPCRIVLNVQGLEWFMYNRTPAYRALEKILGLSNENEDESSQNGDINTTIHLDDILPDEPPRSEVDTLFRRLMPVEIDCERGAVLLGNSDTPSTLIIQFDQAIGTYTTVKARSVFDHYKTMLNLSFRAPKVNLRYNPDYKEPHISRAVRERQARKKYVLFAISMILK